jgi:hypothetical protein
MLGKPVQTFSLEQVVGTLYAHERCIGLVENRITIDQWPEKSPVRKAIMEHNARIEAAEKGEAKSKQPECPGPDCQKCSGGYCETHFNQPCECDVVDRHRVPNKGEASK